ncbi:uncharacterized protein LOC128222576 [Mya arenaria]|uniref:uncharacterized protein LOC128222576 n=1 Tax=Mya arenaria TaxID=6604 RepID=UPI0022DED760|nr:uncharacterized protein LOC128222576 [Mya arenaria]XP_052787617.1 uncharacterized protein LOC128222576 [Mya arenaria]XP_052787618.1 uncharacterized protein LOC128222576 [Mya arenaria]XP_052787619.1 uncharacterized protein LOC128222576 [Mya arenaria]XP_052787620.1 uncharacterized protein LOC128222576 [Mya arenaria]
MESNRPRLQKFSDLSTMVLTEEEQQMFRDENLYPHATVIINNTNRKEEEIEAHKKENIKLLETIRDQKEVLLKARENETKLKETIEELEKECSELREKGNQFKDTLAVKSNELGETREQLKVLQDQFEYKEKALRDSKGELRLNERTLRESEEELRNLKEDLDEELKLQVQRLNKSEENVNKLDNVNHSITMELSEKEEEIKRLTTELEMVQQRCSMFITNLRFKFCRIHAKLCVLGKLVYMVSPWRLQSNMWRWYTDAVKNLPVYVQL